MEKAVVTGELCTEGLPVPLSWEDVGERARVDLLLVPSSTTRTGEALLKEPERIWTVSERLKSDAKGEKKGKHELKEKKEKKKKKKKKKKKEEDFSQT